MNAAVYFSAFGGGALMLVLMGAVHPMLMAAGQGGSSE